MASGPKTLPASRAIIQDEAGPLNPSERTALVGLVIVVLSMVSALVSYLILTGLTTIAPRNEVVWAALATDVVLVWPCSR